MPLAPGARLGPYQIVAPLGAGGMGEVYRACDSRLGREVAIKVLPEHLSHDPLALARFEREAKAIAALSHPNILAIFDIGAEQGVHYVVTELLEGETLRSRLKRGALEARNAARIGATLAEGLAAAHSKGIIHRDLKPDNMFLTSDGRVKILDFGLARIQEEPVGDETLTQAITQPGVLMGTIGYMSPEQARGVPAGPASDIFSLGCVLYEMVLGARAFEGATAAETLSSILRDTPADPPSGAHIPSEFTRLISHCLEKAPELRFQSARDLAFGLKSFASPPTSATPDPGKAGASIAVLPFVNASREADGEYLSDGITESIINSLAQISRLKVTPRSTVFRYKGKDLDPQSIGRELHVRVVLSGRVIQRGETLVVSADLIDVAEGTQLWGERYNRKLADIFEVEEEIARKISDNLRVKLSGEEQRRLAKRYTENTEAYQLYLKGRHYWIKRTVESMKRGAEFFQQAIDRDAGYALAYAGLADCYIMLSGYIAIPPKEGWAKAKSAAATGIALDSELAEAHVSWGYIRFLSDFDWAAGEQELRKAIELNSSNWQAPYWYSILLGSTGRHEEAERQLRRAQELEPLSAAVGHVATMVSLMARKYDEAIERALKGIEIDPSYPLLRVWLGMAYDAQSRYEEAIAELETGMRLLQSRSMAAGPLGHAYALQGNRAAAEKVLRELLEPPGVLPSDPYSIALVYAGLGDREQTLQWLEVALDQRIGWLPLFVLNDFRLDWLRAEPRFEKVLERLHLRG